MLSLLGVARKLSAHWTVAKLGDWLCACQILGPASRNPLFYPRADSAVSVIGSLVHPSVFWGEFVPILAVRCRLILAAPLSLHVLLIVGRTADPHVRGIDARGYIARVADVIPSTKTMTICKLIQNSMDMMATEVAVSLQAITTALLRTLPDPAAILILNYTSERALHPALVVFVLLEWIYRGHRACQQFGVVADARIERATSDLSGRCSPSTATFAALAKPRTHASMCRLSCH